MVNAPVNRRSLLKTLGVTGGGLTLGVGTSTAGIADPEDTDEFISSAAATAVIDTVERPHVETGTITQVEFDTDAAELNSQKADNGATEIRSVSVPTNLGELVVVEFEGERYQSTFLLDEAAVDADSYRSDRNAAIDENELSPTLSWPADTEAYVTNYEDGPRFNRTVTKQEMMFISRAVSEGDGATPRELSPSMVQNERDDITVLADGGIEQYVVSYPKPDELHEIHIDPESAESETESMQFGQVGVQSTAAECSTHAYGCVRAAILPDICGACRVACALRMNLPGYAACIICAVHACGLDLASYSACASAISCLGELGYETP